MSKSLTTTSLPPGPNGMPAIHPGKVLRVEFLEPLNMSPTALARALDIPPNRVIAIVNGERSITAETALLLQAYFRVTAEFWLGLQRAYDLKVAKQDAIIIERLQVVMRRSVDEKLSKVIKRVIESEPVHAVISRPVSEKRPKQTQRARPTQRH